MTEAICLACWLWVQADNKAMSAGAALPVGPSISITTYHWRDRWWDETGVGIEWRHNRLTLGVDMNDDGQTWWSIRWDLGGE